MIATPYDTIVRLLQAAMSRDAQMNAREECPTGDDYNDLFDLVQQIAGALTPPPLPITAPKQEPRAPTVYECPDCDWTGTLDEINGIHHIHHIQEYLEPGELVPAGCCPECNSVICVEDPDIPHHTLYHVGITMRGRGWTVAAPADCPSLDTTTKGA
jgi:hypothetical protein